MHCRSHQREAEKRVAHARETFGAALQKTASLSAGENPLKLGRKGLALSAAAASLSHSSH